MLRFGTDFLSFQIQITPTFCCHCRFNLQLKKTCHHLVTSLVILIVVDLWYSFRERNKSSTR